MKRPPRPQSWPRWIVAALGFVMLLGGCVLISSLKPAGQQVPVGFGLMVVGSVVYLLGQQPNRGGTE